MEEKNLQKYINELVKLASDVDKYLKETHENEKSVVDLTTMSDYMNAIIYADYLYGNNTQKLSIGKLKKGIATLPLIQQARLWSDTILIALAEKTSRTDLGSLSMISSNQVTAMNLRTTTSYANVPEIYDLLNLEQIYKILNKEESWYKDLTDVDFKYLEAVLGVYNKIKDNRGVKFNTTVLPKSDKIETYGLDLGSAKKIITTKKELYNYLSKNLYTWVLNALGTNMVYAIVKLDKLEVETPMVLKCVTATELKNIKGTKSNAIYRHMKNVITLKGLSESVDIEPLVAIFDKLYV